MSGGTGLTQTQWTRRVRKQKNMTHAASHTANTEATVAAGKITIWDADGGSGVGPHEWRFETDVDVDLYLTGVYPGATEPIRILAGEVFDFLSVNRGIQKIEVDTVSSDATINLRPRAV